MAHDLHGYLNVLKPSGWTSHDVVARLRRLSGQRRIGHAGTLDPPAVGVLPVALGRATRTTSSGTWDGKLYWADVHFGTATDTDDATGQVVRSGPAEGLELGTMVPALESFVGNIEQRPPAYSAVHVDGRRAYAEARRGRIEELPARSVQVDAIAVVGWQVPILSLLIKCRSGTYIRSIARDLGSALGVPAHLGALVRLRVGPFDIRDAVGLDELKEVADASSWESVLWPVDVAAQDLDAIIVSRGRAGDFEHGRAWADEGLASLQTAEKAASLSTSSERPHPARAADASPASPKGRGEDRPPARAFGASLASPRGRGSISLVRVYDEEGAFLGLAEPAGGVWQPRLAIPRTDAVPTPAGQS